MNWGKKVAAPLVAIPAKGELIEKIVIGVNVIDLNINSLFFDVAYFSTPGTGQSLETCNYCNANYVLRTNVSKKGGEVVKTYSINCPNCGASDNNLSEKANEQLNGQTLDDKLVSMISSGRIQCSPIATPLRKNILFAEHEITDFSISSARSIDSDLKKITYVLIKDSKGKTGKYSAEFKVEDVFSLKRKEIINKQDIEEIIKLDVNELQELKEKANKKIKAVKEAETEKKIPSVFSKLDV